VTTTLPVKGGQSYPFWLDINQNHLFVFHCFCYSFSCSFSKSFSNSSDLTSLYLIYSPYNEIFSLYMSSLYISKPSKSSFYYRYYPNSSFFLRISPMLSFLILSRLALPHIQCNIFISNTLQQYKKKEIDYVRCNNFFFMQIVILMSHDNRCLWDRDTN